MDYEFVRKYLETKYNKNLFVNLFLTAVFTGVLIGGVELAILAVEELFNFDFDGKLYADTFFALGIFGSTFIFLLFNESGLDYLEKEGKYPALLQVPGAGVRAYGGDIANAEKGIITFQIGIHGIPVTMDPSVYLDLANGVLNGYPNYNSDDRDRFFYKRVYLGCIRANDFITSLPQFDGSNLAVIGGSQGGALSIVTAALDSRVKNLGAYYPALSDVTGYLFGRAGGWPHYFDKTNKEYNNTKEKLKTLPYYDVVNFAKRVKVPGFYSWGFNDETCPPTSMYASYNSIAAPKELFLALETGHFTYPEQNEKMTNWLVGKLKGN